MSNEDPVCRECGIWLENKGWTKRLKRKIDGQKEFRLIEIRRCPKCGKSHRLLPDDQVPFKHYEAEVIEKVVDEDYEFDEKEVEALDEGPCDITRERWIAWARELFQNAEGALRSAAYRILDLSDRFLGSTESLLKGVKHWRPAGWLVRTVDIVLDIGGLGLLPRSP